MIKNSVIYLKDWNPLVHSLSESQQVEFWRLFSTYPLSDKPSDGILAVWTFVKSQLDNMAAKYDEKVIKRNQINGSKGGAPKGNSNAKKTTQTTQWVEKQPKTTLNDNENDNENENVNVNESENVPPPPPQFSMLFEMFKRASMGMGYEDDFLKVEIGKFINKYPNAIAAQSGSLVNSWVAYLNKQKQHEWKLSQKEGNEQTNTIAAAIKRQRENSAKR